MLFINLMKSNLDIYKNRYYTVCKASSWFNYGLFITERWFRVYFNINDNVYSMMKNGKTGELLEEHESKYKELVDKFLFTQQGIIDRNNYGNISNALDTNGFL